MIDIITLLNEAAAYVQQKSNIKPLVGVVLGSGLGNLTHEIKEAISLPYTSIPHFPTSTVEGHGGKLIIGHLRGKPIIAMSGRFHFYEGYSMDQVVFPIRLMKWLGVEYILLSNAAGGMHRDFKVGDLMIIQDHISLFTVNPLIGKNTESLGPRFPDMSEPYDKNLIQQAIKIAAQKNILVYTGVYAGVTGPTFETRSEYKLLQTIGADAVGMSTVPEVIVARHMGTKVFAMSVITDLGIRDEENIITHKEVLEAAAAAEPKLTTIFSTLIDQL